MDLMMIGALCVALGCVAYFEKRLLIHPVSGWLYGATLMVMAVLQEAEWSWLFRLRYFLYVISGFVVAFLPLLFLMMFVLSLLALRRSSHRQLSFLLRNSVIAGGLLLTALFIIWAFFSFQGEAFQQLIETLIELILFICLVFLIFLFNNLLLNSVPLRHPVSVIAIFGIRLDEEETASGILVNRVKKALAVFQGLSEEEQTDVTFIVSGASMDVHQPSEAVMMQQVLEMQGIPPTQIILEERARTTEQNIRYSHSLVANLPSEGALVLVSSRFHLTRMCFYAIEQSVPARYRGGATPIWLWPYYVMREFLAFINLTRGMTLLIVLYLFIRNFLY